MCRLLGYSKQAYYQQISYQEQKALDEYLIVELINRKRKIWKKGSGRNLFASLQDDFRSHGIAIGRDKFFDILRRQELLVVRKSYKAITTMSYHHYHKYPNLIKDKTVLVKSNQIWVSDITYIWLTNVESFAYLSLVTDLYSHMIMGYCLLTTLKTEGPLAALQMAINYAGADKIKGCIHHSDRGVQYCCHEYVKVLTSNKMQISMTQSGNPLENAVAERVNGIIKYEFSDDKELKFSDIETGKKQIKQFVDFYNTERPHSSIERLTPSAAYTSEGELKRCWKTYYKIKQAENTKAEP